MAELENLRAKAEEERAKVEKERCEKEERQAKAVEERRRTHEASQQQRQYNWKTDYITDWNYDNSMRTIAIICGDGKRGFVNEFHGNNGTPPYADHHTKFFKTLDEAARSSCR